MVGMNQETEQVAVVTEADVRAVLDGLKPGTSHSSTSIFARYVRLMEAERRPIASRNALGRALTQEGCQRKRIRRTEDGGSVEIHAWLVPGAAPVNEETERVRTLVQDMGEGIHPVEAIYERYQELAREHGWRWTLDRPGLSAKLTRMGFVKMIEKGLPSRYFG